MKKSTIYLIIGGIAAFFGIRYLLGVKATGTTPVTTASKLAEEAKTGPVHYAGEVISARYKGPGISYTGKTLTAGDLITGALNSDGSMNYLMYGSGIAASSKLFKIPAGDFTEFGKI